MSTCPVCKRLVRKSEARKKKVGNTWMHKHFGYRRKKK